MKTSIKRNDNEKRKKKLVAFTKVVCECGSYRWTDFVHKQLMLLLQKIKQFSNFLSIVSAPKVSNISLDACTVEWNPIRQMGTDTIVYNLQLQRCHGSDHEYKTVSIFFYFKVVCENLCEVVILLCGLGLLPVKGTQMHARRRCTAECWMLYNISFFALLGIPWQ